MTIKQLNSKKSQVMKFTAYFVVLAMIVGFLAGFYGKQDHRSPLDSYVKATVKQAKDNADFAAEQKAWIDSINYVHSFK